MSSAMSHHVRLNSKSFELRRYINAMTFLNHYNNLKKQLKDIATRRIQLGDLAGKLGSFVGQSDVVKKAVKNAIIAVFDNNPHLKTDLKDVYSPLVTNLSESDNSADQADDTDEIKKLSQRVSQEIEHLNKQLEQPNNHLSSSPPSPSPSADPAKLPSKLDALEKVKKLCEKYENLESNKNDPKNLLENLCSGLEKFLGFNPESKGYDGTGIVYSDMDRLCDGVMGFLYGVLKDVSEKQPYNVGKEKLNEALEMLKNKLSTGRKGFEVIGTVAERVREYNDKVRKQNEKVKKPIIALLEKVNDAFKKRINVIDDNIDIRRPKFAEEAVESADRLLEECLQNAETFNDTFGIVRDTKDINNAINDLNYVLRDKVNNARESVRLETVRFGELTKKQRQDLQEMTEKIERLMSDLGNCVNREIKNNVTNLVNDMKERVTKIKEKLESINEGLRTHVQKLREWIAKVEPFIDSALGKMDSILKEVNEGDSSMKPYKMHNAIEQIKAAVYILHGAGEVTRQKATDTVTAALKQVQEMNDALKMDLYAVKQEIQRAIVKHVNEQIKTPFDALEGNVKKGLTTLKGKIESQLSPIVQHSKTFSEQFNATQKSIYEAIQTVDGDLQRLSDLKHLEIIHPTLRERAQLLHAIQESKSFEAVSEYFTKLDSEVMEKVKEAMEEIKGCLAKVHLYPPALKSLFPDIKAALTPLRKVVSGVVPDFTKVEADLKTIHGIVGGEIDVLKLNIATVTPTITQLLSRLSGTISREEVKAVISEVGKIAKAVSDHSKNVIEKVMKGIKGKVIEEVKAVGAAIHGKMGKITEGINNSDQVSTTVDYGGGNKHENARGLKALVKNFETDIKSKLIKLHGDIDSKIFKKATGSLGENDYDLGINLMNTFKTAYDDLKNGKLEQKRFEQDVAEKLTAEIGKDNLPNGGSSGDKISSIAKSNFTNYEKQVNQDSVAQAVSNPSNLKGALPQKIMGIKTQVEQALIKIDDEKDYAQQKIGEITSSLESLCQLIKEDGQFARGNLIDLRDKYFGAYNEAKRIGTESIQKIKQQLILLNDINVTAVIGLADAFIQKDAQKLQDKYITSLNRHVDIQVNDVKKELKHKANKEYVTTTQLLLTHFADRVTEHLKGLPEAIEEDKHTGFKGFMEAFEGKPEVKPREKWAIHVARDEPSRLDAFRAAVTKTRNSKKEEFEKLSEEFKKWYNPLYTYLIGELKRHHTETMSNRNPSVQVADSDPIPHTKNLGDLKGKLDAILEHLHDIPEARKYLFDNTFCTKLNTLQSSLDSIRPASYADDSNPLLECLKKGVQRMREELDKAYVSVYDGASDGFLWTNAKSQKLTDDATRCAKVGLTVCSILHNAFKNFKQFCATNWKFHKINKSNDLGSYFAGQGYIVSDIDQQNGELQDKVSMTGKQIHKCLVGSDYEHVYYIRDDTKLALEMLNDYLTDYYRLCHITHPSTRQPCSVYEMLIWLSGLPCNNVYVDLISDGLSDPFVDPNKTAAEEDELTVVTPEDLYLDAYPKRITYNKAVSAVEHLCSTSFDILFTIAGTGDAYSVYAVDYCSNYLGLKYPTSGGECFQMLLDILRRLLPSLRYLNSRCKLDAKHYGWRDCMYGKDIPTTKSLCKWESSDKATTQAKCKPKCQVNCQPTSPLQSYLNDCLTGHLPHHVTSIGCKAKCTTCPSNKPGQPCLTPFGFRFFCSSTRTGDDISEILSNFFNNSYLSSLFCLMPTPPSTLPEHFDFVLSLVTGLEAQQQSKGDDVITLRDALVTSITDSSIKMYNRPSEFTDALRDAYRSNQTHQNGKHPEATSADLSTLSMTSSCVFPNQNVHCGPYLQSLCNDTYHYLANRHCNMYLSWVIYLPWTLYRYLRSLLELFHNISCQDWGCRTCMQTQTCRPGKHGADYNCKCSALVRCRGVLSTFHAYGFTFGDSLSLLNQNQRRYCHNFNKQLQNVLSSKCFGKLLTACDNFIWTIREPFTYLVLALWSLSLFYLICVMVGRLDVLHIRSHLRMPSSHRITAQSLLAAAQVGRLAKISYLQP